MTLNLHWRILVGAVLAIMAAAFVLPPLAPAPDLKENRKLAPAPVWPADFAALKTLRAEVDAYVADHFPARAQLISLVNYARMPFGVSGSPRVIVGRDGWLFYDDGGHLGAARGDPALSDEDARAWLSGLAGRTETLKAQGVPYLVITAPMKETIYPEQAPGWYGGPAPDRPSVKLTRLAAQSGVGEVLHFHAAVDLAKRSGVNAYGPNDTHWTGAGAYAAYVSLMRRLERLGVGEPPRPMSDFKPVEDNRLRDLAQMLGVGHLVRPKDGMLSDPLAEQRHKVTWLTDKQDWTAPRLVQTGEVGKPTLLITVDSFSTALLPFLYSHFSQVVVAHNQDGAWREDLIARFKPDVVVLEVVESGLRFSLTPAPAPSVQAAARIERALADPNISQVKLLRGRAVATPDEDVILRILAKADPAPGCQVDTVAHAAARTLELEGWISHLGKRPAPTTGLVRLSGPAGDYLAPIRTDRRRPDVALAHKNPMAEISGFSNRISLEGLPPGGYRTIVYRRVRTRWIYCNAPQTLQVAAAGESAR